MTADRKELQVLLVDDDAFVLSIVKRQLNQLGIESVQTADDGNSARSKLGADSGLSLIVCDLMMPGSDGITLLRDIAALQPQAALILMSSAEARVLQTAEGVARERGLKVLGVLPKPVSQEALDQLLNQLDSSQTRPQKTRDCNITADELAAAITNGEIHIHVQPLIRIHDQRLKSVETLARWTSPKHGVVPPDIFIPIAEKQGLIHKLTDHVLRDGIRACAEYRRAGLDINIAVNLSPFMLDDLSVPERIAELAEEYGLPAHNLLLEVTESGVFRDAATSLDILTRLRLRKFGLAIDDYGTGYSSLKQLLNVPFTDLKLDKLFLQDSENDHQKRDILESTIQLAHKLGLKVTSEGVETRKQMQLLSDLGADYAQGFLIAKPMPVEQLIAWQSSFQGIALTH